MQARHNDRRLYFDELARTAERYFMPYTDRWSGAGPGAAVLEIGCGDGGNLLPWARRGCRVTGVDLCPGRIADARRFFAAMSVEARFECADALELRREGRGYDLVIAHDVVEHVADKLRLLQAVRRLLAPGGVAFVAFPPWMMPFGGHQQIARSAVLSRLPFVHLLPATAYRRVLELAGEDGATVAELLAIKSTRCTVESFENEVARAGLAVADRCLWMVNPHYDTKFGLRSRRLCRPLASLPWVRNFLATSCWYMLREACQAAGRGPCRGAAKP